MANKQVSYQPVSEDDHGDDVPSSPAVSRHRDIWRPVHRRAAWVTLGALAIVLVILLGIRFGRTSAGMAASDCPCRPSDVPQYFQTSPQLWPGPTATGKAAFMAQTVAFVPTATYVPNEPLRTAIPVDGMASADDNIFKLMAYLAPYAPAPGFGVDEYPLPPGAEIVQVQMLSRHGSRYPTSNSNVEALGRKLAGAAGKFTAKGPLAFLNDWRYQLGSEILVPKGRQELFDSGVLHAYMYGQLYNPNSKIVVRTTTQDRMLKSAEYFLAGFFGLEWTNNATIELVIEQIGFNNSLAGWLNCPNAQKPRSGPGASGVWVKTYLERATARFAALIGGPGLQWTVEDTFAAQNMCPYETVAYGFSRFCDLFTYDEWLGFGYSVDLAFAENSGFQAPYGRALGIAYQQEVMARLRNHTLGYSGSQINTTLDGSTETFPLNQTLYLDFTHDTNIISVLTAFGLTQFAQALPNNTYPGPHNFSVSHLTPFGARLDIEIISAPKPVAADRSGYAATGRPTKYVHFILNQRTVPLGRSFPECDASRLDGWCDFDAFLRVQAEMPAQAKYDEACHGEWKDTAYGEVINGSPS